jgi:hypothetical protein
MFSFLVTAIVLCAFLTVLGLAVGWLLIVIVCSGEPEQAIALAHWFRGRNMSGD